MRTNQVYNSFLPDEHTRVAKTTTHVLPNDALCCRSIRTLGHVAHERRRECRPRLETLTALSADSRFYSSVMRPLTPVTGVKQTVTTLTVQPCVLSMGLRRFCRSVKEMPKTTRREFLTESKKKAKSTTRMRHISTIGREFLLVLTYSCQNTTGIMFSLLCL